ncbi:MAG: response regulator [Chloroflexi bacterium]|uniref:Response regulator n=1 Tax=Candidatus Chlorohelix allophototropha TaxID=3003348 RepID=A0A8T7LQX8_9CHLR|nr:response regulator [Chloroflexota bacterium]WJW66335.1 response regulator [Chloroflexota bacterium L227-S17]
MSTILVVDDSLIIHRTLGFTLRKHGFDVLQALNGVEALTLLEKSPVNLVIADLAMPRMDGMELLRRMRHDKILETIPFIMLTASGQDEDRIIARKEGANGFLTKPASSGEILQTIDSVLEKK